MLNPRNNAILYEALLGSSYELQRFCTRRIEVIDADADDIQISVLFNMWDVPIKIHNLSNSTDEKVFTLKLPDSGKASLNPRRVQRLSLHRVPLPARAL